MESGDFFEYNIQNDITVTLVISMRSTLTFLLQGINMYACLYIYKVYCTISLQ